MSYDVVISHSPQDRKVAEAACATLERGGHLCWIASRQEAGEAAEGIGLGKVFLLIVSSGSVESPQILREAREATNAGLAIVPFRIEDVQPSGSLGDLLGEALWLDALIPPLEPHLEHLKAIVGRLLDGGQPPPGRPLTMPPQALPPVRPSSSNWLPIALAGLAGLAALAMVAMWVR